MFFFWRSADIHRGGKGEYASILDLVHFCGMNLLLTGLSSTIAAAAIDKLRSKEQKDKKGREANKGTEEQLGIDVDGEGEGP